MNYKIKKGRHYANINISRFWPFSSHYITGTVRFSLSCWHSRDSIDKTGWNKLTGISGLLIHRNSGRLVWQPDFATPGRIIIAAYVYRDGKRIIRPFASCEVEQDIEFAIFATFRLWTFSFDKHAMSINGIIPTIVFKAFPYFGGHSTAPNDMVISVKKKQLNIYADDSTRQTTSYSF